MNLRHSSKWLQHELLQAGIDECEQETRLILQHVTGLDWLQRYLHSGMMLSPDRMRQCEAILNRRLQREPLAYILGQQAFMDMLLEVTPDVLIPRSETEELVQLALDRIPQKAHWLVADMGCGSGAIGIAIARKRPLCRIICTDISSKALLVAQKNATKYHVNDHMEFIHGDRLQPLIEKQGKIHLFLSNPPYISQDTFTHLVPEITQYEPQLALTAQDGGFAFYDYFAKTLPVVLAPSARVLLELGAGQGAEVKEMFEHTPGFIDSQLHDDLQGHIRLFETTYVA